MNTILSLEVNVKKRFKEKQQRKKVLFNTLFFIYYENNMDLGKPLFLEGSRIVVLR